MPAAGGYGGGRGGKGDENRHRERIYFSPACVDLTVPDLFTMGDLAWPTKAAKPLRRAWFRECLGVRTNACPSTLGPQLKRPPLVRQHQEFGGLTPTKEGL